jgi:hypothetical protein
VLVFIAVTSAAAQTQTTPPSPTFTLDLAAAAAQEVSLVIPAPVTLPFKVIRGGGPVPAGLAIDVGNFTNQQGVSLPVSVSIGNEPDKGETHVEPGAFTQALLPVNLHVKHFPAPGKYTGQVILTIPGTPAIPASGGTSAAPATSAQSVIWRFNLTSAGEVRPATLVVDQNAVTVTGARAFCLRPSRKWCLGDSDDEPVVTVHVRDKTGNWPLTGVAARMEPGLKAPGHGFDATSQLVANFNNQAVRDFFSSSSMPPERTLPAREQATVALKFRPSEAGEYIIPLRFTAANSGDDDLQKLTVTLQMRESLIPAVLVLALAALFSFFATRVVSTLRQRAAFLGRVRALRPAWLANEPPILPVIWLRSTLRLAESLSSRFWLTGQSEIETRLAAASAMLAVLDRVRQVRDKIQTSIREPMVQQRAIWKLDSLVNKLGAAPLSEQDVAYFKAQLDKFDDWCDPDQRKWEAAYWADLLPVIQARYAEAKAASLPDDASKLADKLKARLEKVINPPTGDDKTPPPSLPLADKVKAELDFQRLSILLELCRHDCSGLVGKLGTEDEPIEKVRAVVDDAWWKLLKDESQVKPKVVGPPGTLDPPEAYEAVTFRIETPEKPFLRDTYLMQKKLKYHWKITIYDKAKWAQSGNELGKLQVVSMQPQVAQYSPSAGRMQASVDIEYEGDKGRTVPESESVKITDSTDFNIFSRYEMTDFYALGLAVAASIASGVTLHVLKPTFMGSLQDYLTLFTWGAAVDQGKNFVQSLGAYSATTNKPPSQGGGGSPG